MLDVLQTGSDLYNKDDGIYVFVYNESGSIATYNIGVKRASELNRGSVETCEYWSGQLSFGGLIYDDPSYADFNPNKKSNLEWCNENYKGDWTYTGKQAQLKNSNNAALLLKYMKHRFPSNMKSDVTAGLVASIIHCISSEQHNDSSAKEVCNALFPFELQEPLIIDLIMGLRDERGQLIP